MVDLKKSVISFRSYSFTESQILESVGLIGFIGGFAWAGGVACTLSMNTALIIEDRGLIVIYAFFGISHCIIQGLGLQTFYRSLMPRIALLNPNFPEIKKTNFVTNGFVLSGLLFLGLFFCALLLMLIVVLYMLAIETPRLFPVIASRTLLMQILSLIYFFIKRTFQICDIYWYVYVPVFVIVLQVWLTGTFHYIWRLNKPKAFFAGLLSLLIFTISSGLFVILIQK